MTDSALQDNGSQVNSAIGTDQMDARPDPVAAHRSLLEPVSAIGFWSAILLPFLYVPLLAVELRTTRGTLLFFGLLLLHLVALFLGRSYRPG